MARLIWLLLVILPQVITSGPISGGGPSLQAISPSSAAVGASVTLTGQGLGASQGASTVTINGVAATVTSWSAGQLILTVPSTTTGTVIVTVSGIASNALAFTVTTTLAPCTTTTANLTQATVQAAITAAAAGAVVCLPAGSATWSAGVSISGKRLTVRGAGPTLTHITDAAGGALDITGSATNFVDVGQIEFVKGSDNANGAIIAIDGTPFAVGFRLHHVTLTSTSTGIRGIIVDSVYGLLDHVTWNGSGASAGTSPFIQALTIYGSNISTDQGFTPWQQPLSLGTANAVYLEDSTMTYPTGNFVEDSIDCYTGARFVIRYNTFTNASIGWHGTDSGGWRSPVSYEVYHNTFVNNAGSSRRGATVRGGSGVFYDNVHSGGSSWTNYSLYLYRVTDPTQCNSWLCCNGTDYRMNSSSFSADGAHESNTSGVAGWCSTNRELLGTFGASCNGGTGTYSKFLDSDTANGYQCRDQPGVAPGQGVEGVWSWNDDKTVDVATITVDPSAYLSSNRDYFNSATKPGYVAYTYPHPLASTVTTKYVNNSGTPACSNTGSVGAATAPFCTVSYGISQLSSGQRLWVRSGTYAGDFTITGPSGSSGTHTIISAYPGETPVLNGSGFSSGRMKITGGCSYIDFIGFAITNHNQGLYLDDDAGTSTPCSNLLVSDLVVHDVGQEGIAVRAGSATAARNITITHSLVYNTGRLGSSQNGEGIYVGSSSGVDNTNGVTLSRNIIHDAQDECIELKGDSHDVIVDGNELYNCLTPGSSFGSTGGAIEIDEPRNSVVNPNHIIRNNVIHDIGINSGITKRGIRAGTGATIYNNVLYSINAAHTCILSNTANYPRVIYHNTVDCSTANAIVTAGTTADVQNNIGPATSGNNRAFTSADFKDATNHNYHLVTGANTGANLTATVATDREGATRSTTPDIGADEF